MVKAKIKDESLVLTSNMMRFLSLKLLSKDQALIVKVGNAVFSSENRVRLFARVLVASIMRFVGALFPTFPYVVLMMFIYFDTTANCGYKCHNYFEKLPQEQIVRIYAEKSNDNLIITGNDEARQVEVYIPSESQKVISEVILGKKLFKELISLLVERLSK